MNDSPFWKVTVPRTLSSYAVMIFAILWIGLAIVLIMDPSWLGQFWSWVQTLPPVLKILAWSFITPIMTTLWIWESSWTSIARMLAFAGLGGWTLLAVSSFVRAFR